MSTVLSKILKPGFDIIGGLTKETVIFQPPGDYKYLTLGDEETTKELNSEGDGYILVTMVTFTMLKSDGVITNSQIFLARNKKWRVKNLRENLNSFSGEAKEMKSGRAI